MGSASGDYLMKGALSVVYLLFEEGYDAPEFVAAFATLACAMDKLGELEKTDLHRNGIIWYDKDDPQWADRGRYHVVLKVSIEGI